MFGVVNVGAVVILIESAIVGFVNVVVVVVIGIVVGVVGAVVGVLVVDAGLLGVWVASLVGGWIMVGLIVSGG